MSFRGTTFQVGDDVVIKGEHPQSSDEIGEVRSEGHDGVFVHWGDGRKALYNPQDLMRYDGPLTPRTTRAEEPRAARRSYERALRAKKKRES